MKSWPRACILTSPGHPCDIAEVVGVQALRQRRAVSRELRLASVIFVGSFVGVLAPAAVAHGLPDRVVCAHVRLPGRQSEDAQPRPLGRPGVDAMTDHSAALTYTSYLGLDEVLGAQRPRSDEHDE